MSSTGEYMKAIYFKTQCPIAGELELKGMRSNTALDMGVAMRLHIREDRQAASANPALSLAAGDNRACSRSLFVGIGASGRSSARGGDVASDCRHCWLASARLHRRPLCLMRALKTCALDHLKVHLSWRVARGRVMCAGCQQKRGEPGIAPPMLTCSGCRVAKSSSAMQ